MSKHTPGPWGIIRGDAGPIVFSGQKSNMVAHCIKAWSDEERMANARLIAAAPELLEALQAIVGDGVQRLNDRLNDKVLQAIAKATGEQE